MRLLSLPLLLAACAAPRPPDPTAALRELHEAQRRAHLAEDAEGLADLLADGFVEVRDGVLAPCPRAQTVARFRRYFDAVEFLAWEDLEPPRLEIAADGSLATMAVTKLVRTRQRGEDGMPTVVRTLFAWLASAAPDARGDWRITSIASTSRPPGPGATLTAARHELGGAASLARLAAVRATVHARGPTGPYELELDLPRAGPWRFRWSYPDRAPSVIEVLGEEGWSLAPEETGNGTGTRTSLLPAQVQVVRLHALPWLVPELEAFFRVQSVEPDSGDGIEWLALEDPLGHPARAGFAREDDHLVRLELLDATREPPSPVALEFRSWQTIAGIGMPREVVAQDATGEWRLELAEARVSFEDEASDEGTRGD